MQAVLMHKNIEVAAIEFEDGKISEVREILAPTHMPIGTYLPAMNSGLCCAYLQAWQRSRAIPGDRNNLQMIFDSTGEDIFRLGIMSHGMGLTDQYWIRKEGEHYIWEEINFHRNGFVPSPLTLLGYGEAGVSPDFETNGSLPKAWILLDKIPVLLKDSPDWLPTASANEVVASRLAQACGVNHAIYTTLSLEGKTYCASPCFINSDKEEFVSLLQFQRTHRGSTKDTAIQMGLAQSVIDTMTAFDLLIANTDRHEGNFGVIINPDTMEYLHPAPLFDSGTSLHQWTGADYSFKPFFRNQEEAIERREIECSL